MKKFLLVALACFVASATALTLSPNVIAGPLSLMHSGTWLDNVVNRMDTIKFYNTPVGTTLIKSLPGEEFILTKMYIDNGASRWLKVEDENGTLLTYLSPDQHETDTGGHKKRHSNELMILKTGESIVVGGNGSITGYLTGFWVHR